MLERMRIDKQVDVFHAVKQVREGRSELIPSLVSMILSSLKTICWELLSYLFAIFKQNGEPHSRHKWLNIIC